MFLFVPTLAIYILVFLGAPPTLDHGVTVYLLDMSLQFVATGLETDGTYPCLWGENWLLAFLI